MPASTSASTSDVGSSRVASISSAQERIMGASLRAASSGFSISDEPGHDLLAQDPHVAMLALHVGGAQAHPEPGGAGLGQLLDALDPVAGIAGEGEALHRVVRE